MVKLFPVSDFYLKTTSNNYPDGNPGYKLNVFDIRHHQDYSSAQPIKVRFDLKPAVPAATNLIGDALLLTTKKNINF